MADTDDAKAETTAMRIAEEKRILSVMISGKIN
jgi:hypothetical protein